MVGALDLQVGDLVVQRRAGDHPPQAAVKPLALARELGGAAAHLLHLVEHHALPRHVRQRRDAFVQLKGKGGGGLEAGSRFFEGGQSGRPVGEYGEGGEGQRRYECTTVGMAMRWEWQCGRKLDMW